MPNLTHCTPNMYFMSLYHGINCSIVTFSSYTYVFYIFYIRLCAHTNRHIRGALVRHIPPLHFHSNVRRARLIILVIRLASAFIALPETIASSTVIHWPDVLLHTSCSRWLSGSKSSSCGRCASSWFCTASP